MRYVINKRQENRRGYPEWTIQRKWQHCVYKTQDEDKKQTKKKKKTKKEKQQNKTKQNKDEQYPTKY